MYSPIASLSNITSPPFSLPNYNLSLSLSLSQLGYVKLNLAEYAGAGVRQKKYLLESYNENKHKPDNSLLKVRHCPHVILIQYNTCIVHVYMCCLCNSDTPFCCVGLTQCSHTRCY